MKSGFVSIIGRPNVGKSTLLNAIINRKIAITSNVTGTTRNIIQGIYNEEGYQIVFVDTPGIHKPQNKLGKVLNKEALSMTKDVDLLLFVVDIASGIGKGDMFILNMLESTDVPVILVINKIDEVSDEYLLEVIDKYKNIYPFVEIVPVSALKFDNIRRLIQVIKKYLHDEVQYFPEDYYTSSSLKFMVSEIVREKALYFLNDEIPHGISVNITKFEQKPTLLVVEADIICEKYSLRPEQRQF